MMRTEQRCNGCACVSLSAAGSRLLMLTCWRLDTARWLAVAECRSGRAVQPNVDALVREPTRLPPARAAHVGVAGALVRRHLMGYAGCVKCDVRAVRPAREVPWHSSEEVPKGDTWGAHIGDLQLSKLQKAPGRRYRRSRMHETAKGLQTMRGLGGGVITTRSSLECFAIASSVACSGCALSR